MSYFCGVADLILYSCHVVTFHAVVYPCESLHLLKKEETDVLVFNGLVMITEIDKIGVSASKLESRWCQWLGHTQRECRRDCIVLCSEKEKYSP